MNAAPPIPAGSCQRDSGVLSHRPRRACGHPRAESAELMIWGFWPSGRKRAGLRLTMAGLILVGIATVSVVALPSSRAGADPRRHLDPADPDHLPFGPLRRNNGLRPGHRRMVLFGG